MELVQSKPASTKHFSRDCASFIPSIFSFLFFFFCLINNSGEKTAGTQSMYQSLRKNDKTKRSTLFFFCSFQQIKAHYKTTINLRHDNVARTPLTDEKATTMGRGETLEQDRKIKTNTNAHRLQNIDSTRGIL